MLHLTENRPVASPDQTYWGGQGATCGLGGEASWKFPLTTPFRSSESVGDALSAKK